MEQEKILSLILSKLDNIEKEQQEMKKEIFMKLDKVEVRLDKLEKGQESMKEYMLNSEIVFEKFEQDHRFIEKLKKVAGE